MKKTKKVTKSIKVTKPGPILFKIEKDKVPPQRPGKQSTALEKIERALRKMKIGESFLIKTTQQSSVRNMIKNKPAAFKSYKIKISKAPEGNDYRRVFRLSVTS